MNGKQGFIERRWRGGLEFYFGSIANVLVIVKYLDLIVYTIRIMSVSKAYLGLNYRALEERDDW